MPSSKELNIAIVVSEFNHNITNRLCEGTIYRLKQRGLTQSQLNVVWVPGAVEIPLIAQQLAKQQHYHAIIALGAVIRGETSHYDYVCEQVSIGCQRVSLDFEVPVVFGVLTTENQLQAEDRLGGQHGHKGYDAADCALQMISLIENIKCEST